MPKATHVKKARKDYPDEGIKKGDEYWHWAFMVGGRGGPIIRSKAKPSRSQLTRSAFKSALYDLQDGISNDAPLSEDMGGDRDTLRDELQSLLDEQRQNLDNMPEGLQHGDAGQTLQARIDSLEEAVSTLDGIECEYEIQEPPDEEHEQQWRDDTWSEIRSAVDNVEEG